MNELKAVLFDLDDTLFDHRYSSREGLKAVWKRYTCFHNITIDEFEQEYVKLLEKIHFSHVLFGKLTLEEARTERFKHAFLNQGVQVDYHTASNAAAIYRNKYKSQRRKVKGAEELVKALHKDYKIGVISNHTIAETKEKLHYLGYEEYLDSFTTAEEVGVPKPTPRIFRIALEKLEVKPSEAVMVGNSWDADIVGAHNLGIRCIWLNIYGETCPDPSRAVEIKSLGNTEKILRLIKRYSEH
ncbi:MAG: HAD family hydrolase [Chlorobi bacterium]|nr:HAD family hydrolase [Chlorobiota bacterium]MCI0715332.1 HAD family hydrolase [Chlorobiota bacterium]